MRSFKHLLKRKPQPWHLSHAEMKSIDQMMHSHLVAQNIRLMEQQNRIVRALVKLKQAIAALQGDGG